MRRSSLVFVCAVLGPFAPLACGARTPLDADLAADVSAHDSASELDVSPPLDAPADHGLDAPVFDAPPDVGPDAPAGLLTLSIVGVSADRVSPADQGIYPDGKDDGYFSATAVGAFDALILVTVSQGQPAYGQQWDTLVLQDPIPPLGFAFSTGDQTWVLGVWENGQLVSDSACRIALSPGTHTLQLVGSSSGYFVTGTHYRLYGRLNGTWIMSNVAVWP